MYMQHFSQIMPRVFIIVLFIHLTVDRVANKNLFVLVMFLYEDR